MTNNQQINTGGGAYIHGDINTDGGDFIGRDKHEHFHLASPTRTIATPPRPPAVFVGQADQLELLTATLIAGKSAAITALQGMGGIGKTTLAQQLAVQLKTHFTGGIFWADLERSNGSAESILRTWSRICGEDLSHQADVNMLVQIMRDLMTQYKDKGGPILAVIDDVRDKPETWLFAAQLIKESLPVDVPLLFTTRQEQIATQLEADKIVRLDVLSEMDALTLLTERVQNKNLLQPSAMVNTLLKSLGYLPLAIRLAAAYLNGSQGRSPNFALADFVVKIKANAAKLIDTQSTGLVATFRITYDVLTAEQQRAFRYASVYSANLLTVEHLVALLQLDEAKTQKLLDELVDMALLDWVQEQAERYALHPLLRQYSYEQLQHENNAKTLHQRAAEHLYKKLTGNGGGREERFEEIDQWQQAENYEEMVRSVHHLQQLVKFGYLSEIEQRIIEAQKFVHHLKNAELRSAMLWSDRGFVALEQNKYDDAIDHLEHAHSLYEKIGDTEDIALSYNNLGSGYLYKYDLKKAYLYYKKGFETFKKSGNQKGILSGFGNLANVFRLRGEFDNSIDYFKQALALAKREGYLEAEGRTYLNIGSLYRDMGQLEDANINYSEALEKFKKIYHNSGVAQTSYNMGIVYRMQNKLDTAKELFSRSIILSKRFGLPVTEQAMDNLIQICGSPDSAIIYLKREEDLIAKSIVQQQGMPLEEVFDLIAQSRQGDINVDKRLRENFSALITDPEQPQDIQELSKVLMNILNGNHQPDLTNLPSHMVTSVNDLMGRLDDTRTA